MIQPKLLPVPASDDLYAAGPDVGTVTKVDPGSGIAEQGKVPEADWAAQWQNFQENLIARHVASVADIAALNWSVSRADGGDALNFNAGTLPVRIRPFRIDVQQELLVLHVSDSLLYSFNSRDWTKSAVNGAGGFNASADAAYGPIGGSSYVVALPGDAGGNARASSDLGVTWGNAGTIAVSAPLIAGYYSRIQRFYSFAAAQIYYSDNLFGAWTNIPTTAGWVGSPPSDPRCFAESPTEIAVGIGQTQGVVYSQDGATFLDAAGTVSGAVIALAWSESHQLWGALIADGKFYTAPAGFSGWTLQADLTPFVTPKCLSVLGRTWIVGVVGAVIVSRDGANWRYLLDVSTRDGAAWQASCAWQGRIVIGKQLLNGGDYDFESSVSLRSPGAFDEDGPAW